MSAVTIIANPPPEDLAPNPAPESPISPAELERALKEAEPTAFFVPGRIVRRVIKQDAQLTGLGLRVPHRKSYVISRERLLEHVEPEELGLDAAAVLPETVLLIAQPEPEQLREMSAAAALAKYWRLLFHCRVHAALEQRVREGRLDEPALRSRLHAIGQTEFDEIRQVLAREDFLLPPRSDLQIYIEFAAVYLELKLFAAGLLPHYFPSLRDPGRIDELLARDFDADELYQATRLAGCPDPSEPAIYEAWEEAPQRQADELSARPERLLTEKQCQKQHRRAEKAASEGNLVRAAIIRARTTRNAPSKEAEAAQVALRMDMDCLVHRLRAALELSDESPGTWHEALVALANCTTLGIWTVEARLLYDLQKVCLDHEREIYTVDMVEWALSLGTSPIKRALPSQREVLMTKHLRSAARRLTFVRLSHTHRRYLSDLLKSAAARAEERMRDQFRPLIVKSIAEVGLTPKNLPERVAFKKLVEELLDRVADRGFLTMGDLRDALSRNNLKLPDFAGSRDFRRGDPLLRIDRRLASSLDGVYNAGEIYLRWLQQLSSLAFGTPLGRFVTRFVAIPFGGAYVALAGLQHLADVIAAQTVGETAHIDIKTTMGVLTVGMFILCNMQVEAFRKGTVKVAQNTFHGLRGLFYDFPMWLARLPVVQRIVQSKPFKLAMRFLVKPLLLTAMIGVVFPLERINLRTSISSSAAIFLAINLLMNSRAGRKVEEVVVDWAVQNWHRFGLRILTGLYWLVIDVFKSVVETIDRFLYTVDEWLRFRSGESGVTLVLKAILGVAWFFVTYVIRFCVNLLIEPQINPIKHFPVVTVSHKLLIPFIPTLAHVLSITMDEALAFTVATVVITSIPGIFGFLVWELKENWRLYAANRKLRLTPAPIGSHGETMARFLRPGFHSGTLPKLYSKLRRAERRGRGSGNWQVVRKHVDALHHAELALRRHVEREFVEMFGESPHWGGLALIVGEVQAGSNRVLVEVRCPTLSEDGMWLSFEAQAGWITGGVVQFGWAERLTIAQRKLLAVALAGTYKIAGLDIVKQQLEAPFPADTPPYELREASLVVWPEPTFDVEIAYELRRRGEIRPQVVTGLPRRSLPVLSRAQFLFRDKPIAWDDWVQAWETSPEESQLPGMAAAIDLAPKK